MDIEIRLLAEHDKEMLLSVASGVFDNKPDLELTAEFLGDPRHHLAVALDEGVIVGMASAVHYVHPDKPPQLWINEVGVAPTHRGLTIGKRLINALLQHGRNLGCTEAWVLTENDNTAAMALYESAGGKQPEKQPVMFNFSL